jgi:uncharacterized protein YkwD
MKHIFPKKLAAKILACIMILTITTQLLPIKPSASAASASEQTLFRLLNEDRTRYGLPALIFDDELSRIARIKSQDMVDNRYFAHVSPTYGNVRSMLTSFGISYRSAGENIARSRSVQHSNAAFLSSEGHRRNMLSKTFTHVGIGVVTDARGFVTVTEIFVRR